jgi:predicted solute-binding protein
VLDLGERWTQITGKPFVWAAWIGGAGLTPDLAGYLAEAADHPGEGLVELAKSRSGWEESVLRDYLFSTMRYRMDEEMLGGLREFRERLLAHGFEDCCYFPEIVGQPVRP